MLPVIWKRLCFAGWLSLLTAADARTQDALFSGLVNQPLGAATLQVDPVTGYMHIGNIGSSGQDGVRIAHGPFEGLDLEWAPMEINNGVLIDARTLGRVSGVSNQVLAHTTAEALSSSRVEIQAVFPQSVSNTKRLELLLDGQVVASFTTTSDTIGWGQTIETALGDAHIWRSGPYVFAKWTLNHDWDDFEAPWEFEPWEDQGTTYTCDAVRIVSDDIAQPFALEATELRMRDLPEVVMQAEGVRQFGHQELGRGNVALVVGQQGVLEVTNIGSSGLDGIDVAFDRAEHFAIALNDLPDVASLPFGAKLDVGSTGNVGGQSGEDIGSLEIAKAQGLLEITPDYAGSGASGVLYGLYAAGALIDIVPLPLGSFLRVQAWPSYCGKRILWPLGFPCYWVGWDVPTQLELPGAGFYLADEVRILAENPAAGVAYIETFSLRGTDVPSFEIAGISSGPIQDPVLYCTAKSSLVCGAPALEWSGVPSASASSGFVVGAHPVRGGRTGLLFYTDAGRAALPFQGGLLCVSPPLRRMSVVSSGGTAGQCDGAFELDVNAFAAGQAGGNPAPFLRVPGQQVNAQWWGRDSVQTGSLLSAGIEWIVAP